MNWCHPWGLRPMVSAGRPVASSTGKSGSGEQQSRDEQIWDLAQWHSFPKSLTRSAEMATSWRRVCVEARYHPISSHPLLSKYAVMYPQPTELAACV
jgi:hypothetical protein